MIIDAILGIFYNFADFLLMPLVVVDIAVDFISSIPLVMSFLQVIAYLLPWQNLMPLFGIIIAIFTLRIAISIFRLVKSFIPGMGGM